MQAIKFRVFRPSKGRMMTWDELDASLMFDADGSQMTTELFADHGMDEPPPVVMQFTGLLDKLGNEIYEGDVVRVAWLAELGYTELDCGAIACVVYDDCAFVAEFNKPYKRQVCEEGTYEETSLSLTKHSHDDDVCLSFTIIGNAYENPELLNTK